MAPHTENGGISANGHGEDDVWTVNQHLKEADPEVHNR